MEHDYISVYKAILKWLVRSGAGVHAFTNVDDAFNYIELLGVEAEEADAALIALAANNHNRAEFELRSGKFIKSDYSSLPTVGIS
jgi:hypothetical protein